MEIAPDKMGGFKPAEPPEQDLGGHPTPQDAVVAAAFEPLEPVLDDPEAEIAELALRADERAQQELDELARRTDP